MLGAVFLHKAENCIEKHYKDYSNSVGYLPEKHRNHRSRKEYHHHYIFELSQKYFHRTCFSALSENVFALGLQPFGCFFFSKTHTFTLSHSFVLT